MDELVFETLVYLTSVSCLLSSRYVHHVRNLSEALQVDKLRVACETSEDSAR